MKPKLTAVLYRSYTTFSYKITLKIIFLFAFYPKNKLKFPYKNGREEEKGISLKN
jgi:hypothetical protein